MQELYLFNDSSCYHQLLQVYQSKTHLISCYQHLLRLHSPPCLRHLRRKTSLGSNFTADVASLRSRRQIPRPQLGTFLRVAWRGVKNCWSVRGRSPGQISQSAGCGRSSHAVCSILLWISDRYTVSLRSCASSASCYRQIWSYLEHSFHPLEPLHERRCYLACTCNRLDSCAGDLEHWRCRRSLPNTGHLPWDYSAGALTGWIDCTWGGSPRPGWS